MGFNENMQAFTRDVEECIRARAAFVADVSEKTKGLVHEARALMERISQEHEHRAEEVTALKAKIHEDFAQMRDRLRETLGASRKHCEETVHTLMHAFATTRKDLASDLHQDEFNRSRAEANNVLLSILEERLLELPTGRSNEALMQVHPYFSALFTSNPEEYAGVHKTQDALLDRMITVKVGHHDRDTETHITQAKSGQPVETCNKIVEIVRKFRMLGVNNHRPTVRACIMIARILALRNTTADENDRRECRHGV